MHTAGDATARDEFARHGLDDVPRVSDPERALYRAFGLGEAGAAETLTPVVLRRGVEAWRAGHRPGLPRGNARQMPGLFLVYRGEIADAYRHATVGDRPDYVRFVRGG